MGKEHFKNLQRNSPNVTDKPIMTIINHKLDIKPVQFTQEEPRIVLANIKKEKVAGFNEILPEVCTIYQPLRSGMIWHKVNF